ncbi:MAG: AAA family ATPase [Bacteroidetes bacterium]|nr:AAA family ATPase [Bacteroidota bacterium]
MIIIGITGTLGAGKGTIVDYLVGEKGFVHYSVRTYLLEKIRELGMAENRDSMFTLANELRSAHGPSYVTDQLYLRALDSGKDCVIESIRTPGEIESLRAKGHFFLLAADADPLIRYRRILLRQSETDLVSWETFTENEAREMSTTDPNKQNLRKCIEMADFILLNNGTKKDLILQVDTVLDQVLKG